MDHKTHIRAEGFADQRLYRIPPAVGERMSRRPHLRDFQVTDLGYFPQTEGHEVSRPRGTGCHILIFVEAGQGWLELDGRRFTAGSSEVILIPPHIGHAYGASRNNPWRIYWFHFLGAGAEALLEWSNFTLKNPTLSCPAGDGLRRQFRTALTSVKRGYSDRALLDLARTLINVLTLLHQRMPEHRLDPHAGRVEQIMDHMREHLNAPETLAAYARRSGLSVSGFSQAFREHCGVSPMTYFSELRIQRACELLDTTDLRVGEIAQRLGFSDALYFSRLFRKHTGKPPTEYRKLSGLD